MEMEGLGGGPLRATIASYTFGSEWVIMHINIRLRVSWDPGFGDTVSLRLVV